MTKTAKVISLIQVFVLMLFCLSSCSGGSGSGQAGEPASKTVSAGIVYESIKDFSVDCTDGSRFTLSEELKDHELVMIELFESGCQPCAKEFSCLQEAWEECSDKVSVIALSCAEEDTMDVLKDYASGLDLKFAVGREEGTDLDRYASEYPAAILVDKEMRIIAGMTGNIPDVSKNTFLDWFGEYTGDNFDPSVSSYTVYAYGNENSEKIAGAVINFCTDTACTPVRTSEDMGKAVFSGTPEKYHIQVVSVPDGWQPVTKEDLYTETYSGTFYIAFEKVDQ